MNRNTRPFHTVKYSSLKNTWMKSESSSTGITKKILPHQAKQTRFHMLPCLSYLYQWFISCLCSALWCGCRALLAASSHSTQSKAAPRGGPGQGWPRAGAPGAAGQVLINPWHRALPSGPRCPRQRSEGTAGRGSCPREGPAHGWPGCWGTDGQEKVPARLTPRVPHSRHHWIT